MKMKFRVYVGKPLGEHDTFEEAFKEFFNHIMELLDSSQMTYMVLETACWIEGTFDNGNITSKLPIFYYDVRDFAYQEGLLVEDGKRPSIVQLQEPIPADRLMEAFLRSGIDRLAGEVDTLLEDMLKMSAAM